jgi:hypothetical protein
MTANNMTDNVRVNVTLRRVRATTVAVKSNKTYILSVFLYAACTLLYCHMWFVCIYYIFPQYITKVTTFGKPLVCFDFLYDFCLKYLSF